MIERITDIGRAEEWQKRDIFSIRIMSLLKAYTTKYPFALFYYQIIDGRITALISKLDGDFTISVDEGFDTEEIIQFLCVTGYSSVLCDEGLRLNARYNEGVIMKSSRKIEFPCSVGVIDEFPKLMDLYNFIDYNSSDFKAWYVDISHRIRHGTAKAYTLNVDDGVVSSGILSSIFEDYSILTAVRTENEYRNQGFGSALVSYICGDVKGTVYLMRDDGMNEGFYKRLGFEDIGRWRMYR